MKAGGQIGKTPAIVLEIAINPEATATLQDWEIESNVQGSLHYANDLSSDIVALHREADEIISWIKAVKEGERRNAEAVTN